MSFCVAMIDTQFQSIITVTHKATSALQQSLSLYIKQAEAVLFPIALILTVSYVSFSVSLA